MVNKRVFLIGLIGVIFLTKPLFAQIPTLKDVTVSGSVVLDNRTGIYTYNYSVFNPSVNKGKIFIIEVDISRPANSKELSSKDLVIQRGMNIKGEMMVKSFEEEATRITETLERPVIPVGACAPLGVPFPGWDVGIAIKGTVTWGGSEQNLILPDQRREGFLLTSYGLPTIRDVTIKPLLDEGADYYPKWEDVEDADEPSAAITAKIEELEKRVSFSGKTIGPTAPPAELKPVAFLDHIISMKHEAAALGWITDRGVERSLDAKLDAALKNLQSGNTKTAGNILGAFINEVEAQGCPSYDDCPDGKHLKPEAYALLKFNAQYLIDNLR